MSGTGRAGRTSGEPERRTGSAGGRAWPETTLRGRRGFRHSFIRQAANLSTIPKPLNREPHGTANFIAHKVYLESLKVF